MTKMKQAANTEKIFVTKEFFDLTQKKLLAKRTELAAANTEKIGAYQSDTNTWHDNFAYENAARIEALLKCEANELDESLKAMVICPKTSDDAPRAVELWTFAKVAETNIDASVTNEKIIGIVPVGGEDFSKLIYSYRAPIAGALMGAKIGETRVASIPSGELRFDILEITRMK
ncbi:MAG: GreA/GreB family elongation factor [Rickettsiales bacterium]|jgi:transcription elongation GreA/GreB family factor|nr:GreA/GreB family elongation factor [Rickettsiales bacterium]